MVDEPRPTKKVVKKVVKRTVVRPTRPGTTTLRPPTTTGRTASSPARPRAGRGGLAKLKAKAANRPSIRIPSPPRRPGAGLADRARLAGNRVVERGRDVSFSAGRSVRGGLERLRDVRLPHLPPLRGAAITGIVAGLLAVILGYLSYELFSATRGTTAGGGWGALVLVVVAFATFAVGELMLGGFGVDHGRVISLMAIMLVLVLVLTFFLDLAAGRGAWVLIPILGMVSFVVSCKVILFAADQPDPR